MASLNRCEFIGNLGRDPEVRYTPGGIAVAQFSLACNETWKDANGEKKERVEWVRCKAWGKLGEIVGEYLKKGAMVYAAGRMETRKWEKDGIERYSTEIVLSEMKMLDRKGEGGYQPKDEDAPPEARRGAHEPTQSSLPEEPPFQDDDIPF